MTAKVGNKCLAPWKKKLERMIMLLNILLMKKSSKEECTDIERERTSSAT